MKTRIWDSFCVTLCILLCFTACATSTHATEPANLGVARSFRELVASLGMPGILSAKTVSSCSWVVPLSGMVNLEHPKAIAAGLEDRDEPIEMYFHVLRHPTRGMFIIDTGVERAQRDDPDKALFRGLLASVMNVEAMKVQMPLGDWLKQQPDPLAGVFLTHLHLDHIAGMRDVPARTPIYSGPGETKASKLENMFVQGVVDEALEGKAALREWKYSADSDGRFAGLVDIFGDGSLWAIWVPGHTPGSTAYLAHTTDGPVLYTGDASHTAWGWEHGVEPGEFTADREENAIHLAKLKALVDEFPQIQVRLGHQELVAKSSTIASSF